MSGVGIGNLTGTLWNVIPHRVVELLETYLGPSELRSYGSLGYARSARVGPYGSLVAWEPRGEADMSSWQRGRVHVSITQTALDSLGWLKIQELSRQLHQWMFRPTRVDTYWDDRKRLVEPMAVIDAARAKQCRTRVKSFEFMGSGRLGEAAGETGYLGSRKSMERLRVYDKEAESKVVGAGIRWELQSRDELAQEVFRELLVQESGAVEFAGEWFAGRLVRLIDFVEREAGQAHAERSARLDWWEQLVGEVRAADRVAAVVVDTLEKKRKWASSAWGKTAALLTMQAGGSIEWFRDLIEVGKDKMGPLDWKLITDDWEATRARDATLASCSPVPTG